jgi:hypothetical protein
MLQYDRVCDDPRSNRIEDEEIKQLLGRALAQSCPAPSPLCDRFILHRSPLIEHARC